MIITITSVFEVLISPDDATRKMLSNDLKILDVNWYISRIIPYLTNEKMLVENFSFHSIKRTYKYSPSFAGRCLGRVALCHPPLTGTHFDPTIFSILKKVVVSHRANEPIYLAHGTSSDTSWKRATRVVAVRYRG